MTLSPFPPGPPMARCHLCGKMEVYNELVAVKDFANGILTQRHFHIEGCN